MDDKKPIESAPTCDAASEWIFRDNAIHGALDLRVYRLAAIQKTGYRLADRCTAVLGAMTEHTLPVTFLFPFGTGERQAREAARLFFQELLDQELREQIGDETRAMRSLLLAHAFSQTDLIQRD